MRPTMQVHLAEFESRLQNLYDNSEIRYMYQLTLEKILGVGYDIKTTLSQEETVQLVKYLQELEQGRPLQYVLGSSYFWDQFFEVQEGVLIPRPETEELLYWIKQDYATLVPPQRILDIGTGSGCIAVILQKIFPKAEVWALDISEDALKIAKNNAQSLPIHFHQGNILDWNSLEDLPAFDLIVSNPPYISEAEKMDMHTNVLAHEPHLALFVSNGDVQQFYKAILHFGEKHVESKGRIYIELNAGYAQETEHIYAAADFQTTLKKDMQYKDRMLRAIQL